MFLTVSLYNLNIEKHDGEMPLTFYTRKRVADDSVTMYPCDDTWCVAARDEKVANEFATYARALGYRVYDRNGLDFATKIIESFNNGCCRREEARWGGEERSPQSRGGEEVEKQSL